VLSIVTLFFQFFKDVFNYVCYVGLPIWEEIPDDVAQIHSPLPPETIAVSGAWARSGTY
jgi:hypothetical protein